MMTHSEKQPFACPHSHDFQSGAQPGNERRVILVIILTVTTMAAEIICGIMFGSMALLADGWHMASHASAMGITAMAYYLVRKHRDNARFTFGTGKINDLAGYSSALLLAFIALFMAYESVLRLLEPHPIRYNEAMMVAIVGLVVNVACALILKEEPRQHHTHDNENDHHHDPDHNLRSAYIHVLADALTSILAIVALFFGKTFQWSFLDPAMGIVGAIVISRWSYGLLRQTGRVLLDHNTDTRMVQDIRQTLLSAGASSVDDLHLWRLAQGHYGAVISMTSGTNAGPQHYKAALRHYGRLSHVTIEINRQQPA